MQRNKSGKGSSKPGLTDLKRLAKEAEKAAETVRAEAAGKTTGPKRPRMRPGDSSKRAEPVGSSSPAASGGTSLDANTAALTEADRRLFLQAVRHVERIRDPNRVLLPPVAIAAPTILKERRLRAAGLTTSVERKVGRAQRESFERHATAAAPPPDSGTGSKKGVKHRLSDDYTPAVQHHDDRLYLRRGHGQDVIRDLRRGKWPIGASLDLHGSTVDDARERFDRFLNSCLTHEIRCVRIVHGKGIGSREGESVLKATVRRWLSQLDEVIAYTECSEADGGSGAVQVLLRSATNA